MNYNKKDWCKLINRAIALKLITNQPALIAYYLAQEHADWETGKGIWCSKQKLAIEFGWSRSAITKAFKVLEDLGFITRDPSRERAGSTYVYDLTMTSESAWVLSERAGGCTEREQGVLSESAQTTNITTNVNNLMNNEETTPADQRSAGTSQSEAPILLDYPKDDISLDSSNALEGMSTSPGVLSQRAGYGYLPREDIEGWRKHPVSNVYVLDGNLLRPAKPTRKVSAW